MTYTQRASLNGIKHDKVVSIFVSEPGISVPGTGALMVWGNQLLYGETVIARRSGNWVRVANGKLKPGEARVRGRVLAALKEGGYRRKGADGSFDIWQQ